MSQPSKNSGMNRISVLRPNKIPMNQWNFLLQILSNLVLYLKKNSLFFMMLIVLLFKSFLFIGIANNDDVSSFSLLKGFHSYQAPPSILIYTAFLIAFLGFSQLLKGKLHFLYLFFINVALSFLMIGDLMYYRGFGSFLSPYVLSQSSNLDNLLGSIVSMLRPIDSLFLLDFVFIIAASKKISNYCQERKRSILAFLVFLTLSISTIYYQHYRLDIQKLGDDMLFRVAWVPNQTMTNLSPVGYHVYDLYNYYKDNKLYELKANEVEDIGQWFTLKEEQLPDNQFKGILEGKNVIAIQVESLENFVINQKVQGQEITPNLNRLLQNSLYFSNIYEQVHNGNSSDADLIINTSVYPVRSGATFFRFPMNTYNSLPKLMKNKGYTTLGIHPDKGAYWNWMQALNSIGFDKTIDASYFNQDEKIGLGLSDGSYFSQVAPLLVKETQPFYTFMVTLSSHSPFELPEKYQELKLDTSLVASKLGGYFESIHYTDREIGRFLENLEKNQLIDNTVIVIYGDHTGVHKYYNDEIQQLEPSQKWWLDSSKRIPFIIYYKELKGQELEVTGGQIDIMPTIAYLLDLDQSYRKTALGRNLLNTKRDFAILGNRDFVGSAASPREKEFLIRGIDISDLIIRSNYYKRQGY